MFLQLYCHKIASLSFSWCGDYPDFHGPYSLANNSEMFAEMLRQAGVGGKTSSPKDRALNRQRDRTRFASPGKWVPVRVNGASWEVFFFLSRVNCNSYNFIWSELVLAPMKAAVTSLVPYAISHCSTRKICPFKGLSDVCYSTYK